MAVFVGGDRRRLDPHASKSGAISPDSEMARGLRRAGRRAFRPGFLQPIKANDRFAFRRTQFFPNAKPRGRLPRPKAKRQGRERNKKRVRERLYAGIPTLRERRERLPTRSRQAKSAMQQAGQHRAHQPLVGAPEQGRAAQGTGDPQGKARQRTYGPAFGSAVTSEHTFPQRP